MEIADAMDDDARWPAQIPTHHAHVHCARRRRAQAPEDGRRMMAEHRVIAAGERGCHRASQRRLDRADEEDAAMQTPQPPLRHTMCQRMPAESGSSELRAT